MANGSGIRIPTEHTSKFNEISAALDANNIGHSVWNIEAMLIPDYKGPIDLNCDDPDRWDDFVRIVKGFTAPQNHDGRTD